MPRTPNRALKEALIRHLAVSFLFQELDKLEAERRASIQGDSEAAIAARKRYREDTIELLNGVRVFLKYPADEDGSYDELIAKLDSITRSISQLQHWEKIDQVLATFPYNYIFPVLIPMLLAYVLALVF